MARFSRPLRHLARKRNGAGLFLQPGDVTHAVTLALKQQR